MRKNIYKYTVLALFLLIPKLGFADIDIATYLLELSDSAKRESGKISKDKIAGLQTDSMNLSNPSFSNINPSSVKNAAMSSLKDTNKKFSVSDKLPGGLADKINGTGSNPALEAAAKKEFTVSKRSGDDVKKNQEVKEKINDLMIENVSLLYARGLVRRYQLENEQIDEVQDFNNINAVQSVLANTVQRANNRWMSMLQSDASMMAQSSLQQLNAIRLDEEDEEDAAAENAGKNNSGSKNESGVNGSNNPSGDNGKNESGVNGSNNPSGDNGKSEEKKKSGWEKAADWVENQGDKAGDWLNKGNNQEGVNKIIHGAFGDDSDVGSALTEGTDFLSKRGTGK